MNRFTIFLTISFLLIIPVGCSLPPEILSLPVFDALREASPTTQPTATDPVPSLPTDTPTPTQPFPTLIPTWTPPAPRTPLPPLPLPEATQSGQQGGLSFEATYGPDFFPTGINPLTGLQVVDPGRLERRPMIVKITNFPRRVRPQSGLTIADLVYEYYIESGLTRFAAIYYGEDASRAGPIRSGRFFDEHLIRMYDGILVFANADQRVMDAWRGSDIWYSLVTEQNGNCPPVCRDRNNPDYNNLYVDTQGLGAYVVAVGMENRKFDQSGMKFQSLAPWGGKPAGQVFLRYSALNYNRWEYDAASGRYFRWQETRDDTSGSPAYAPLMDELTGEQVGAENVIVIFVNHEYSVLTDTTEMIKIALTRSGNAYIFRDGAAYQARWVREGTDGPLQFTRTSGTTFPLKPGRTFIQVIGITSTMSSGDDTWQFNFDIP